MKKLYKTDEQKKEIKRLYDIEYRKKNLESIKKKKAAWFQRDYDPVKAAVKRKERMPYHVEYCQQPEYKKWKKKYDEAYRAKKQFGEFWQAFLIVTEINKEVLQRASRYEIGYTNGVVNKSQNRSREYERLISNKY
jgi:hypothetical protein